MSIIIITIIIVIIALIAYEAYVQYKKRSKFVLSPFRIKHDIPDWEATHPKMGYNRKDGDEPLSVPDHIPFVGSESYAPRQPLSDPSELYMNIQTLLPTRKIEKDLLRRYRKK